MMAAYYAVVTLGGELAYSGRSLTEAAIALEPGTVFGAGDSEQAALSEARVEAIKAKAAGDSEHWPASLGPA